MDTKHPFKLKGVHWPRQGDAPEHYELLGLQFGLDQHGQRAFVAELICIAYNPATLMEKAAEKFPGRPVKIEEGKAVIFREK